MTLRHVAVHLLETLETLNRPLSPWLARHTAQAQSFWVDQTLLDEAPERLGSPNRLPFPSILIETAQDDQLGPVLAFEDATLGPGVVIWPVGFSRGAWVPSVIGAWVPSVIGAWVHDDKATLIYLDERRQGHFENVGPAIWLVSYLTSLLQCRNVETAVQAAPAKLNAARAKRGKPPLPDYRKVVIHVRDRQAVAREVESHASPRAHWRRGHFRRLPQGQTFVRACLVNPGGTPLPGGYEVRP